MFSIAFWPLFVSLLLGFCAIYFLVLYLEVLISEALGHDSYIVFLFLRICTKVFDYYTKQCFLMFLKLDHETMFSQAITSMDILELFQIEIFSIDLKSHRRPNKHKPTSFHIVLRGPQMAIP